MGFPPFSYLTIETPMGQRVYSGQSLDMVSILDVLEDSDGELVLDSDGDQILVSIEDFSFNSIDERTIMTSIGVLGQEIISREAGIIGSYTSKMQETLDFTLSNKDYLITKAIGIEPFMRAPVKVYLGYNDLPMSKHVLVFEGEIDNIDASSDALVTFTVAEGTDFSETHFLSRAGRYAAPLKDNDLLPLVWGDLTDGSDGVWTLPCIDTANHVYAYSDGESLSVANGNVVTIYVEGVETAATFDESDNYEGKGIISTITFSSTQGNDKVTARGMGRPTTPAGSTLMENIVDIVDNFLINETGFDSGRYDKTSKIDTRAKFEAKGYTSAGVVTEDAAIWETVPVMMGSFLGSAFFSDSLLRFAIDDGLPPVPVDAVPLRDFNFDGATMNGENHVNRCPAEYQFSYVDGNFGAITDDIAQADAVSIGTYGTLRPPDPFKAYFCRDLLSMNSIQTIIVNNQKDPTYDISLTMIDPFWILLQPGDTIGVDIESLFGSDGAFDRQNILVLSSSPNLYNLKTTIRALDQKSRFLEYVIQPLLDSDGDPVLDSDSDPILVQDLR